MNIRNDQLQTIPIDQFVSASGRWVSIFTECYQPQHGELRAYFIVIVHAGTNRIRLMKPLGFDRVEAEGKWIGWSQLFSQKSQDVYEDDIPSGLHEFKISPPYLIEKDAPMLKWKPKGARINVRDITPVDEVTARAEAAGIIPVIDDAHKPRPTTGIVLAVGEDPLAQELYKVGDLVMFSPHAGNTFMVEGQQYRNLELHEIINALPRQEGMEDIMPDVP